MRTVVFLHGFGGSGRSWSAVVAHLDASRYRSVTVDLPGHGESRALRPADYEKAVELALGAAEGPVVLCGYSMGARVALAAALAQPERAAALVLVSGHAGIEDDAERAARAAADEDLAERISTMPPGDFADLWNEQPLFAGDPPEVLAAAREEIAKQDTSCLAAALRGLGPGAFEPAWNELPGLRAPLLALAGDRDARYCALAARMGRVAPAGGALVLRGGHRLPLESPAELAGALQRFDAETRGGG